MAKFQLPGQDDELLGKSGTFGTPSSGGPSSSPSGSQTGGIPAPQQAPASGGAPDSAMQPRSGGTGFVNLENILAGNQQGAQAMGQKLLDKANSLGNDATSAYQKAAQGASDNYNKQYQDAYTKYQTDLSNWNQANQKYQAWNPLFEPFGYKKPADPGFRPEFKGTDAPQTISGYMGGTAYGDLENKLQKASGFAKGLQTDGGLASDINEVYGGPQSPGGGALDAFLARSANGPGFAQAAQQFGGLSDLIGQDQINKAMTGPGGAPIHSGNVGVPEPKYKPRDPNFYWNKS